eukprot:c9080_g1_i1 orf=369-662(-)
MVAVTSSLSAVALALGSLYSQGPHPHDLRASRGQDYWHLYGAVGYHSPSYRTLTRTSSPHHRLHHPQSSLFPIYAGRLHRDNIHLGYHLCIRLSLSQ